MQYTEIAISFVIGILLSGLTAWVFSLKTKGLLRLLFNALAGVILLICLNLFKVAYLPLNPLNALLAGFLGVPGVALVFVINRFL